MTDALEDLDLSDTEKQALDDGALTEEGVRRTHWWADEMERCQSKIDPILTYVGAQDDMNPHQHGTEVNSDGKHIVNIKFVIEGERYEEVDG